MDLGRRLQAEQVDGHSMALPRPGCSVSHPGIARRSLAEDVNNPHVSQLLQKRRAV